MDDWRFDLAMVLGHGTSMEKLLAAFERVEGMEEREDMAATNFFNALRTVATELGNAHNRKAN